MMFATIERAVSLLFFRMFDSVDAASVTGRMNDPQLDLPLVRWVHRAVLQSLGRLEQAELSFPEADGEDPGATA